MPRAPNGRIIPHTKEVQLRRAKEKYDNAKNALIHNPDDNAAREIIRDVENSQLNSSPRPVRGRTVNARNNLNFNAYPNSPRRPNILNSTTHKKGRSSNFNINNNIYANSKTRRNLKNAGRWAFYRKFSNTHRNVAPTGIVGKHTHRNDPRHNYSGYAFKGKPTLFSKNYNSVPWKEEIPEGAEGMYEEYGKEPIAVRYLGKQNSFNVFKALE